MATIGQGGEINLHIWAAIIKKTVQVNYKIHVG
jgi:hypothetical protein